MPERDRIYRIDHTYEDRKTGPNEFVKWLGIKNAGGVRPVFRSARAGRDDASELAALVLVSRHVSGSGYNPWQDIIERRQGRIFYWGDAKGDPSRSRDDFHGNRYLAQVWRAVNEHRWHHVPPLLHFSKEEKGKVRFNGLCVIADLQDAWFEDDGRRVRNYHATLDILPVDAVRIEWIRARVHAGDRHAPTEWNQYARTGTHGRLVVWRNLVRRRTEQLPPEDSHEWRVLLAIHQLEPITAERLIVRAFTEMEVAHNIVGTRPTKDGGFDFHGTFVLPPPLGYTIPVKGEVKRYNPARGSVGPVDVARLVARLQRGEHGVFVTTSAFTEQCQDEVFADGYPLELIPGGKLVAMLEQLGAARAGQLADDWVRVPA